MNKLTYQPQVQNNMVLTFVHSKKNLIHKLYPSGKKATFSPNTMIEHN